MRLRQALQSIGPPQGLGRHPPMIHRAPRNHRNGVVTGFRNRRNTAVSGSRNCKNGQKDLWIQKSLKWCSFWNQKLQKYRSFWIQKLWKWTNKFLDPEIVEMVRFLDPDIVEKVDKSYIQILDTYTYNTCTLPYFWVKQTLKSLNHDGTVLNVKNVMINSKCDICHISTEIAGHIQTHCDAFHTGGAF